MTTPDVYMERAEAGALALDIDEPGWLDRIDLDRLDLGCPEECVRGQLWGHYMAGPGGYDAPRMIAQGFTVGAHPAILFRKEARVLTGVWRELITKRRAEAAL